MRTILIFVLLVFGAGVLPLGAHADEDAAWDKAARRWQGDKKSRVAIAAALDWLAAHQSPNGGWEAAGFPRWRKGKPVAKPSIDGAGKALYDVGVTGLALQAFLQAGFTGKEGQRHATVVREGLRYLRRVQDPEGCFGPRSTQQYVYNHALAAIAMVVAYGRTRNVEYLASAQKGLDFTALARNPYFAWRYGIKPGDNDTSVTSWMIQALAVAKEINAKAEKAGRPAPLSIDASAFDGVKAWLGKVTDPTYGRVGYISRGSGSARPMALIDRFPGEKSEAMTAAAIVMRLQYDEAPASAPIQQGARLVQDLRPVWIHDGSIDMYYWYYGARALRRVKGPRSILWLDALVKALVRAQRTDGDDGTYEGSWDPVGPWGPDGGRVYSTALMALSLLAVREEPGGIRSARDASGATPYGAPERAAAKPVDPKKVPGTYALDPISAEQMAFEGLMAARRRMLEQLPQAEREKSLAEAELAARDEAKELAKQVAMEITLNADGSAAQVTTHKDRERTAKGTWKLEENVFTLTLTEESPKSKPHKIVGRVEEGVLYLRKLDGSYEGEAVFRRENDAK